MKVSQTSPVSDKDSYLYNWDTCARKYFSHFEIHKVSAKEGLQNLFKNMLTSFRDPIRYRDRFQLIDDIMLRQLLGDISSEEVREINNVIGTKKGLFFVKGYKEPASLIAWRPMQIGSLWLFGTGLAGYAKFVKGYNILWFVAPYLPLWTYLFYNYAR